MEVVGITLWLFYPGDNRKNGVYTQYYDTEAVARSLDSVMKAPPDGSDVGSQEVRRSLRSGRMGDDALSTVTSRIYTRSWQKQWLMLFQY